MPHIGLGELVIIVMILMLLFGANRMPELARSLGQAIRNFKEAGRETKPRDPAS